jgi:glutaredoxin
VLESSVKPTRVFGPIRAITYTCSVPASAGLCARDTGAFRHQFEKNLPKLAYNRATKKWQILCRVKFLDGPLKAGITDYEGEPNTACRVAPKVNAGEHVILGELKHIQLDGKADGLTFQDAVLATDRAGAYLYILDMEDVRPHPLVATNPERVLRRVENPVTVEPEGPVGDLAHLVKYNSDGILNNLLAAEEHLRENPNVNAAGSSWCTQKHLRLAKEHHCEELVEHLQSGGRTEMAQKAREFCDRLAGCLTNPKLTSGEVRTLRNDFRRDFLPETACDTGGICSHDRSAPHPHDNAAGTALPADGLTVWTSQYCTHCHRTLKLLDEQKVPYQNLDVTTEPGKSLSLERGITRVPFLELRRGGEIVAEHLGEPEPKELKELLGGNN